MTAAADALKQRMAEYSSKCQYETLVPFNIQQLEFATVNGVSYTVDEQEIVEARVDRGSKGDLGRWQRRTEMAQHDIVILGMRRQSGHVVIRLPYATCRPERLARRPKPWHGCCSQGADAGVVGGAERSGSRPDV